MVSRILFVILIVHVTRGVHPIHTAETNNRRHWNIHTTMAPPITPKPRQSRNILDSIRAVTEALKRVTENRYKQKIVSAFPNFQLQAEPTEQAHQSGTVTSHQSVAQSRSDLGPWASPTEETRFDRGRNSFGLVSNGHDMRQSDRNLYNFGTLDNRGTSQSQSNQHNVDNLGIDAETSMLNSNPLNTRNYESVDLYGNAGQAPVALYAIDTGHEQTTTEQRKRVDVPRSRYRLLPDGSVVDFGIRIRNDQLKQGESTTQLKQPVQARTMTSPVWSPEMPSIKPTEQVATTNQVFPNGVNPSPTGATLHGQTVINPKPTGMTLPMTSQGAAPMTSQGAAPMTSHGSVPMISNSVVNELARHAPSTTAQISTTSAASNPRNRVRLRNTGIPVRNMAAFDDSRMTVMDDPSKRGPSTADDSHSKPRVHSTSFPVKIPKLPLTTNVLTSSVAGLNITVLPTSTTTRRRFTTTTHMKTTTTTTTTTTTPAPTTTPKPTQDPEDVRFYSQGGFPINITLLNDNHVCPKSRARWQDYTVYLETKPRLCMIQITFHARYKREPIYTNTWWSNTVDYVYKTVYDPEIKMVDLHTWSDSWYG